MTQTIITNIKALVRQGNARDLVLYLRAVSTCKQISAYELALIKQEVTRQLAD